MVRFSGLRWCPWTVHLTVVSDESLSRTLRISLHALLPCRHWSGHCRPNDSAGPLVLRFPVRFPGISSLLRDSKHESKPGPGLQVLARVGDGDKGVHPVNGTYKRLERSGSQSCETCNRERRYRLRLIVMHEVASGSLSLARLGRALNATWLAKTRVGFSEIGHFLNTDIRGIIRITGSGHSTGCSCRGCMDSARHCRKAGPERLLNLGCISERVVAATQVEIRTVMPRSSRLIAIANLFDPKIGNVETTMRWGTTSEHEGVPLERDDSDAVMVIPCPLCGRGINASTCRTTASPARKQHHRSIHQSTHFTHLSSIRSPCYSTLVSSLPWPLSPAPPRSPPPPVPSPSETLTSPVSAASARRCRAAPVSVTLSSSVGRCPSSTTRSFPVASRMRRQRVSRR